MIDGNVLPGLAQCHGITVEGEDCCERYRNEDGGGRGGAAAEDLNFIGATANQCEQSLCLHNI